MKASSMKMLIVALAISMLAGCGEKEAEAPVVDGSTATAESDVAATAAPVVASGVAQEYVASAATVPGGHCFLDAINGGAIEGATAQVGQEVSFGGWISDINNQVPTAALFVLEGSGKSYSTPLVAGGERPDVAAALANEALKNSGYNVLTKLDGVAPGEYALAIILGSDFASRCELNAKLVIAN